MFQRTASVVVPDVTVTTVTPPPRQPSQRARRPTTLAYCQRSVALPRVRRTLPADASRPPAVDQPKPVVVTVTAEVVAAADVPATTTTRVVAPTATPEDSYVEDGSSSCAAAVTADEFDAVQSRQSGLVPTDISAAAPSDTGPSAFSAAQRPHDDDRRTPDTSCLDSQPIPEAAERLSTTSSTADAGSATLRASQRRLAAVRRIHRVISGARQRLRRQLSGYRAVAADEKPTSTTAFCGELERVSSRSATGVDDATSESTSSQSLVAVDGCSSTVAGMSAASAGGETDVVCWGVGSASAAALSDCAAAATVDSDTETVAAGTADLSLVASSRRISPASPSYDEKHARFSHVGAHALDVFFSPEDDDDDDDDVYEASDRSDSESRAPTSSSSLWRPLVASCSANIQRQPSTSSAATFFAQTRSVALAGHVTSGPRLPSEPEAVRQRRRASGAAVFGSTSVQGLGDDVTKSTSSVLAVLGGAADPTRSSTSTTNDSCCVAAAADNDRLTLDVSHNRFIASSLSLTITTATLV